MTIKELILCSLADDSEAEIQILGYLEYEGIAIKIEEIRELLGELIKEGLVHIVGERECMLSKKTIETKLVYEMTPKGREVWNKLGGNN